MLFVQRTGETCTDEKSRIIPFANWNSMSDAQSLKCEAAKLTTKTQLLPSLETRELIMED